MSETVHFSLLFHRKNDLSRKNIIKKAREKKSKDLGLLRRQVYEEEKRDIEDLVLHHGSGVRAI